MQNLIYHETLSIFMQGMTPCKFFIHSNFLGSLGPKHTLVQSEVGWSQRLTPMRDIRF
jgi:hypothetical protein